MALKHVTTRRKPYRSTESLRRAVKTNSRGLTSLAFAQLDPGRPRDPPYLHSVYSAVKNSLSLLHNFKVGPTDVEGRELIISKVKFIVHVATLNVHEMFIVPESTAFCML